MMDTLSIIAGVATLLRVAVHVGTELQIFCDDVVTIRPDMIMLIEEVESFRGVLEAMKTTFSDPELQETVNVTGHLGEHWKNVSTSLGDAERTMLTLLGILQEANKETRILDAPRRLLRYNVAAERIKRFVSQVASCKMTLQLSLEAMML